MRRRRSRSQRKVRRRGMAGHAGRSKVVQEGGTSEKGLPDCMATRQLSTFYTISDTLRHKVVKDYHEDWKNN